MSRRNGRCGSAEARTYLIPELRVVRETSLTECSRTDEHRRAERHDLQERLQIAGFGAHAAERGRLPDAVRLRRRVDRDPVAARPPRYQLGLMARERDRA